MRRCQRFRRFSRLHHCNRIEWLARVAMHPVVAAFVRTAAAGESCEPALKGLAGPDFFWRLSVFSIIQAAGWSIWALILASIVTVALIVERSLSLRRRRILPAGLLDEVLQLHRGRQIGPEMLQRIERSSPLGVVLANGLRHEHEPRELMKEALEESGRLVSHQLERYLQLLGTIAAVAPLMGLFGTVIGMIEIFGSQAPTGTNPQQLAHGISVALYNTALGIAVAIPALIAYRLFRTKIDDFLVEMEQQSLRLVDTVKGVRR